MLDIRDKDIVGDKGKAKAFLPCKDLEKTQGVIGSEQGHMGDALASAGDEGRDKLR